MQRRKQRAPPCVTSAGSRTAAVPMMTRVDAFLEPGLDRVDVADAAAELQRNGDRAR